MKFIIIIPILLLAVSCIKPVDTSPHIAPADMDADYCLDLKGPDPVARLVKKYRDLEPALLDIPEKQYLECYWDEYYYFYFFEKERNWDFPVTTSGLLCVHAYGESGTTCLTGEKKISRMVQIDFPESEIIDFIIFDGENSKKKDLSFIDDKDILVDKEIHKKEDLLQFKNKIIDVEIYKDFRCQQSLDTSLSIKFRARITGECEDWPQPPWNIGATNKDSVVAKLSPDGTLVIGGKGKMTDFDFEDNSRPWHKICREENIKVVIENGVTHIGDCAFRNCRGVSSATIGSSVAFIYKGAFEDCEKLSSITVLNPTPPSLYNNDYWSRQEISTAFEGVNKDTCTIYVPKGSVDAYRYAHGWGEFRNIKPIE